MAHFLTLILLDPSDPDPARKAEELMLPYFEADEDHPNPQAQCDGFTIGGRYDGTIWGKEQHYNLKPADFQKRYGLDVVKSEDNICPVPALATDLVAYAVVSPDGQWHSHDGKSEAEWLQEFRSLLQQYNDKLAVAIDCHC